MADKKAVDLSKLPFNDLKDKVKEVEGSKSFNRFEMTRAILKADNRPMKVDPETGNPRQIKPEIAALKSKLAETPAGDKKTRQELRRAVTRLKRASRRYL